MAKKVKTVLITGAASGIGLAIAEYLAQKGDKVIATDKNKEALAVLKRNIQVLFFDDEMYQAIIFHHGQWSKYYPIDMNELATLVHRADMIASQTHFV